MRISTDPFEELNPQIDEKQVQAFFENRALKVPEVGALRAAIYQDKHPDLAEKRDEAEKNILYPLLALSKKDRVLDIGCGTGRWTRTIAESVAAYIGTDFSAGMIEVAAKSHSDLTNVNFRVLRSSQIEMKTLGVTVPFDKILMFGLLIYLNDDDVTATFKQVEKVSSATSTLLIREPVGIPQRLTLKEHFSEDLEQDYNAIYRTEEEIIVAAENSDFVLHSSGFVYQDSDLNNRAETIQKWLKFRKKTL